MQIQVERKFRFSIPNVISNLNLHNKQQVDDATYCLGVVVLIFYVVLNAYGVRKTNENNQTIKQNKCKTLNPLHNNVVGMCGPSWEHKGDVVALEANI